MKALQVTDFGTFNQGMRFHERPRPQPAAGQITIDTLYVGLNPHDCKLAMGELKRHEPKSLPYTPGSEVVGIVRDVSSDVSSFKPGDRVFGIVQDALAETCIANSHEVTQLPKNLAPRIASSISVTGMTVLQSFERIGGLKKGQRILIHAGVGGVGSFAIQYAKLCGVYVYTTVSTQNTALAASLGADEVIDYTQTDPRMICSDLDVVFDTLGGQSTFDAFEMIKRGGQIVSVVPSEITGATLRELGAPRWMTTIANFKPSRLAKHMRDRDVGYKFIFMRPQLNHLCELSNLLTAGKIKPLIDRVVPFEQCVDAFAYLATGRAKGKVVIAMPQSSRMDI